MNYQGISIPLFAGLGFLICAVAIELICILLLNDGLMVYTLDDPYIHLALSENIRNGHYGINSNEFSAPSSSILWPFILAPFASYPYTPLVINVVAAVVTVYIMLRILSVSFKLKTDSYRNILLSVSLIFILLATNIIGLPFTGMEHSLQVLLTLVVVFGLIVEIESKKITSWFLFSIVVAPLIRYECMAISAAALAFLMIRGHMKSAIIVTLLLILFIGGYSIFLYSLGLEPLPTSILAKSTVVQDGGSFQTLLSNLENSLLSQRQGMIMWIGVTILLAYLFFSIDNDRKQLALVTIMATLLHFLAGQFGWYHRYEIYSWAFILLSIIYILGPSVTQALQKKPSIAGVIVVSGTIALITGAPYIHGLFSIPYAANNIFEQQYQMHRFAVDYYQQPVAVNDLGYVSYKNQQYVLDLWGLGSEKALKYRQSGHDQNWMKQLSHESGIGLAMIYRDWFIHIPNDWIAIGTLHLGKPKVTPARSEVIFYATNPDAMPEIIDKLHAFIKTLPAGVRFSFQL